MSARTISISVTPEVEEKLERAAEQAGMPLVEWIVQTAATQADVAAAEDEGYRAAMRLVQEYEAEHGPIPEEHWREARQVAESMAAGTPNGAFVDQVSADRAVSR